MFSYPWSFTLASSISEDIYKHDEVTQLKISIFCSKPAHTLSINVCVTTERFFFLFYYLNNWFGILPFWRVAQLLLTHWGCLCQNPWPSARRCELRSPARRSRGLHTSSFLHPSDSSNPRTRTRRRRLLEQCHTSAGTQETRKAVTAWFPLLGCVGAGVRHYPTTKFQSKLFFSRSETISISNIALKIIHDLVNCLITK